MRKLFLAFLLLACSDADPTGPLNAPLDTTLGTYQLVDLRYANPVVTMEGPVRSDYRLTLASGEVTGNGQAITIRATRRSDGLTADVYAYVADGGRYSYRGDEVDILALAGGANVAWLSGVYRAHGDTLHRYIATYLDTLETVWVRE
jgi:hypothetical protein